MFTSLQTPNPLPETFHRAPQVAPDAGGGQHEGAAAGDPLPSREAEPFNKPLIARRRWYPTPEEGNTKGLLLVITTAKDGALSGGPKFMRVSAGNCNSNPNAGWGFS